MKFTLWPKRVEFNFRAGNSVLINYCDGVCDCERKVSLVLARYVTFVILVCLTGTRCSGFLFIFNGYKLLER